MVEEKDRIGGYREAFSSLKPLGSVPAEIVGVLAWRYEHRGRRREDLLLPFDSNYERGPVSGTLTAGTPIEH